MMKKLSLYPLSLREATAALLQAKPGPTKRPRRKARRK
jgi:hypothetical protein